MTRMISQWVAAMVSVMVLLSVALVDQAVADVDRIKELLSLGDAQAAFEEASRLETNHIGQSRFDFYYGMAAIQTGRPGIAALAFERVLLNQPQSPRVRLELARAYFQLNDLDGAQKQFETVLAGRPPAGVRKTINRFLEGITVKRRRAQRKFGGSVKVGNGFDSNINSATSADFFQFQLGTVFFPDESRKTPGGFSEVAAGVNGEFSLGKQSRWFASTNFSSHANWDLGLYDTNILTTGIGYLRRSGSAVFRIPISVQAVYIDGDERRYSGIFGLDYARPLTNTLQWVSFSQSNIIRNPRNAARDSNLFVAGTGLTWLLPKIRGQVMSSVSIGHDHALNDPVFGKVFASSRIGFRAKVNPRTSVFIDLDLQSAHYEGQGSFLKKREDILGSMSWGFDIGVDKYWSFVVKLAYSDNHSNLTLYDYDRTMALLEGSYRW